MRRFLGGEKGSLAASNRLKMSPRPSRGSPHPELADGMGPVRRAKGEKTGSTQKKKTEDSNERIEVERWSESCQWWRPPAVLSGSLEKTESTSLFWYGSFEKKHEKKSLFLYACYDHPCNEIKIWLEKKLS